MSRYCLAVGLFLGLLARSFSPSAGAENPPPHDANGVPVVAPAVRKAMQDRDYAAARKAIDEAAKAKDAPSDYLAYLRAWSLHLDKQYDQAIAALAKFEKDYPQSAWLRRVRFAKAQAMVGKGDFRGAQAIYESEAKYLLSDARRQQSAEIYLEFGDALFQPPVGREPDYRGAREIYARAIDAGLSGLRRLEVEFRIALCLQKLGQYANAAKGFEDYLSKHVDDRRQAEVRYRLGECLLSSGNLAEARKAWRELVNGPLSLRETARVRGGEATVGGLAVPHAPSPPAPLPKGEGSKSARPKPAAARDWAGEAAFHLAETWHCPQPRDDDDLRRGVAALRDFLARYPGHELAGQAQLEIAAAQINRQRYDDAVATLHDFLRDPRWKDRKELPDALRELGNVYLTQHKYAEAVAVWRDYLVRYPANEGWSAVQQSIIDAEYGIALEKFKAGDYDAATRLWTDFLGHYPLDGRNPNILFLFGEIQQRQKKWEAAVAAWQRLTTKYPHSQEAARAEALIARILDEQLGRYEEAREHYNKAGDTAASAAISARQMAVETEHVFRSDETPGLKLATRNVPSVKVRVYKIDLETYFRKMQTVAGIERLDVSLIDPDATFEYSVPDYIKYKRLASFIPAPLPDAAGVPPLGGSAGNPAKAGTPTKAGAAAVTVSSPTQEATTLVIQSDLEIVLRALRGEALVFAQNIRSGKPWPGVRLLLSDGKSIFAEGKTDSNGFYSRPFAELGDETMLRVFAAAEGGHVASTALRLTAGQGVVELSDRIFISTDRAAYRAGEPVHVRGCARHAHDGRLVVEPGKKLSVELFGSADRRLGRQNLTLSALGTFSCDFPLPAGMPEGDYSIVASDDAGHHRTVQFEIESPPVDDQRLEISLPRRVYYRGETIEGTIRAVLPYDRPLIGAKVEYRLGAGPPTIATTDARGEARFAIATDELEQYGAATLSASVPARDLAGQCDVTVATRGFSIGLSTARPVFVAGESVEVKIKTEDAAHQPIAVKLAAKVSRQVKNGDETRDEKVEEHLLATAADGTAKLTLKPAKGGQYTVSVSGTDRFGNTIERSTAVRVSDDDDSNRLLLLVDRTDFKVGDAADVQLYWRGDPTAAVVTTHYDRLREHRLIELHKGFNRLTVPVTAAMAPGFTLGVAVMDKVTLPEGRGRSLCQAECDFTVNPNLQVKIESHRHGSQSAKPQPGEPIDVTVTTCDAQGKPVAAEVSLSVLPRDGSDADKPGPNGALPRFSLGRGHAADFQTASSIQFHYRPLHRDIAADVAGSDATGIPPGISPQVGIEVGPRRPTAKLPAKAPTKLAAKSVADDPFSPEPDDPETGNHVKQPMDSEGKDTDSQADFRTLQSMIQKNGKSPQGDDPFAPEPTRTAARNMDSDADSAAGGMEQPAEKPAPNIRKRPHRTAVAEVTHASRPSWPGYWNASIATGADGRATVSIAPTDGTTELTIAAQAIAAGNLAGQTSEKLTLKKDLSAELHLPPAFTDGDEVEIPVVLHNEAIDHGKVEVELAMDVDGSRWCDKKTINVKAPGRLETSFKPLIRQAHRPATSEGCFPARPEARFTLTTSAAGKSDVVRRSVPILPYGAEFRITAAGTNVGDAAVSLAPSRRHWTAPTLQIAVSPSAQRSLLDMLEPPAAENIGAAQRAAGLSASSDLMAALALHKLHPPQSAESRLLEERIRTALCLLIATQQPDGGWLVRGRAASPEVNALAYWSLVLADKAGYEVPRETLEASLGNIRQGLASNPDGDSAAKAILVHTLAITGQGDFSLANQLLRDRKSLSPLGRAYLALALVRMDRKDAAAEVLKQLPTDEKDAGGRSADIEAQAVTALALLALDTASPRAKSLLDSILSRRQGLRWIPENATGPAVLAAAEWLGHERAAQAPRQVVITVNGKQLKALKLDPRGPTQIIEAPAAMLVKGKQEIALHVTDQQASALARIAYRATLSGVDPAENVSGSSAAWQVERSYEPPLMEVDGQTIPRGFTSISGYWFSAAFSNRMTQLPAARHGFVELTVRRNRGAEEKEAIAWSTGRPELTIVEPLPSGAMVVPSSLQGAFDRTEILPGRIVIYLNDRAPNTTIRYELEGVFPGANLVSPTLLLRAGSDAPLAVARPKALVVLPQGAKCTDPYRLSPDELLALATIARQRGDAAGATRYFSELLETWHGQRDFGLTEPVYKQTVVALMQLGMGRTAPTKLVQYCETIKEKWPQEPVTLDQLLTAAAAYREIGETERSYLACRAAIEGSFTRECGTAGFLENQGHFLSSVGWMERLIRDYPPEPYTAEAEFGLAQRVYAQAEPQPSVPAVGSHNLQNGAEKVLAAVGIGEMPAAKKARNEVRDASHSREALIGRAGKMLDSFLSCFPNDAAADQAAFAAANAQLDLKHYAAAADSAAAAARRYPKSDLLDSYWYMLAYCDFALGKYPAAIDMCRKVADARHLDKQTGRMVESQNERRAIYILGQIYQSLGRRADAIREYRRVEDRIPDAKASVAYFARKEFALPECTTLRPGATADVELRYRNIAACDVKVYRVDLVKFCEAGQALGDIGQVNLSGIRPLDQSAVALTGGGDYADHVQKLSLPLKKEGAYLVVCRGEDLYASGLVLVSPLEIEHRIDAATGQVRVFVKDAVTGRCSGDAQVKILPRGPNVQANVAGTTDLRGVFVTACPPSGATIVAQAGPGQYAYIATSPRTNEPQGGVAQVKLPDIDPTVPFQQAAGFEPLMKLIRDTVPTKSWQDNGGQGTLDEFPTQLAFVPHQGAARGAGVPQSAQVRRPLPAQGPNAPTNLAGEESLRERSIREALASPITLEFKETPLKDVVAQLKNTCHIEIQLDMPGLKDAGVELDTPVSKSVNGLSLQSALKLMLDDLGLKYVIHNEALMITSPAKAESDEFMTTKAYPVTDLVLSGSDGTVDFQPLSDLLQNTVATKSWLDNGGNGTMSDMLVGNRAIIVLSQTQEVHEQIEQTLEMLRKAGGLKSGARKLVEQEQSEDETDLPARPRLHRLAPAAMGQGSGGGMGGGMGGMGGGMGGGMPDKGQTPFAISVIPSGDSDLLGGLRANNASNQQSKVQQLKQRQDAGQNTGAGGMGGGFF